MAMIKYPDPPPPLQKKIQLIGLQFQVAVWYYRNSKQEMKASHLQTGTRRVYKHRPLLFAC